MKRTRKAHVACMQCRRAHLSCSDVRPCERCVAKHIEHLCNDETLHPEVSTFTADEMQTISKILGDDVFGVMLSNTDEFDLLQAANELDYSSIFLQDTQTFLTNKSQTITPPAHRPIMRLPSTNYNINSRDNNNTTTNNTATSTSSTNMPNNIHPHAHMVHGIIVNQPPSHHKSSPSASTASSSSLFPSPSPLASSVNLTHTSSNNTNRLNSVVIVHTPEDALNTFYNYGSPTGSSSPSTLPLFTSSPSPLSTPSPLSDPSPFLTPVSTHSSSPSSDPLSSLEFQDALTSAMTLRNEELQAQADSNVTSALTSRNEELQAQVAKLEEKNAKLQRAIEEKDKQLENMLERQAQQHAKLKILLQCRIIPQALDITLVERSKSYGVMTALYDIKAGVILDYNRNFGKMLTELYGADFDITKAKMPPGPMERGVEHLVNMMVADYFKESLEKYTYIRMPSGEKLPFLFSLTIQCWERAAGPLMNFTYWI